MNLFDFDDSAIRQTNVHKISKISPKNATISPAEIFPGHLPLSTADPTQWKHFGRITSNLGRCSTTLRPNTYAIITTENTPNAINQSQPTKNKEVGRRNSPVDLYPWFLSVQKALIDDPNLLGRITVTARLTATVCRIRYFLW